MRLPHLGILLTTYCNLNCRDCADLIPKRKKDIYKIDLVVSDMTKLLKEVEYIDEVLLIGGETFLYKDINKAIDFCAENPKVGKIIITSNGTFAPSEEILDKISERNVVLRISGYPEFVAPKRKEVIQRYRDKGIEVEDLADMTWCSVGDTLRRNRSVNELSQVFSTCIMKNCVAMQCDGKIFFCSRQMAAYETDMYPDPESNEFVDVRNSDNLKEELELFYSHSYLTTCDYCDGISCETKKTVETAIQILPVRVYLNLIEMYSEWDLHESPEVELKDMVIPFGDCMRGIEEYIELLYCLRESYVNKSEETKNALKSSVLKLINRLSGDYNYILDENIKEGKRIQNRISSSDHLNVIKISKDVQEAADIVIDEQDIENYINTKFQLDVFSYTRLYIRSKFARIKDDKTECIVCGLSYTQYGILENGFPKKTVNLSVTGQDIAYQTIMARHALAIKPDIKTIIMPMTYYQGFYDIVSDDAPIHQSVVSRINIPVLHESRGYTGLMYSDYISGEYMKFYDHILDAQTLKEKYERKLIEILSEKEFFNEYFVMNPLGGLKFDYKMLSEEEKYESGKVTADLNERIVTKEGKELTLRYLSSFLKDMKMLDKKVVIFVPPMTKYLYRAYSADMISQFRQIYPPMFAEYYNVKFIDLACDPSFENDDFCDYEHLNHEGAVKLTRKLAAYAMD